MRTFYSFFLDHRIMPIALDTMQSREIFSLSNSTEVAKQKQSGLQYNSSLFTLFQTLDHTAYQKKGINTLTLRNLNFINVHKFWAQDHILELPTVMTDSAYSSAYLPHRKISSSCPYSLLLDNFIWPKFQKRTLLRPTSPQQNIGNKLFNPTIYFVTSS